VAKGSTLILQGAASITLHSGKAEVLGAPLGVGKRVVVRRGRSLPFEAQEDSSFEVVLGANAAVEEVSGSTIPRSWEEVKTRLISEGLAKTVLVLGATDSGKTTFCTYLVNSVLSEAPKAVIVDADLGQSDIGPPGTISLSVITQPVVDLFTLDPEKIFFAGVNTPSRASARVLSGLSLLREGLDDEDFIIVNTDGWVDGERAEKYKISLMKTFGPAVVVGIQKGDELEKILRAAEVEGFKVLRVESPSRVTPRDKSERRRLREQGYHKFLRGAVTRIIPLSWTKLEYTPLSNGTPPTSKRLSELESLFDCRIHYCEESSDTLLVVFGREKPDSETFTKALDALGKRVYAVNKGDEKGLLVGLLDERRVFVGIGVICEINYTDQIIKIHTPVERRIGYIQFGQIVLNKYGKELGVKPSFSL